MSVSSDARTAAIAVNRFGLGARVDEPLPAEPQSWLLAQFAQYNAQPAAWSALPSSAVLAVDYANQFRAVREAGSDAAEQAARQTLRRDAQTHYRAAVNARATVALTTPAPFVERLVHFWANHFAVLIEKAPLASLAGAFEAEAIRPHVLGRFEDMLLAVERHPAMLLYLDQSRSIGPGSVAGRRAARLNPERQRGLNENLAREILELHTLGVRSGYGQADVTELARALTGWSIGGVQGTPYTQAANAMPGAYNFFPALHEPGTRTVLNRDYAQRGEAQAVAVLRDLAASPATARHVAQKLARHFVADVPPPALVDRLTQAFLRSGGHCRRSTRCWCRRPKRGSVRRPNSRHRGTGWCRRCAAWAGKNCAKGVACRCRLRWRNWGRPSGDPALRLATTTWPRVGPRPMRSCVAWNWRSDWPRKAAACWMRAAWPFSGFPVAWLPPPPPPSNGPRAPPSRWRCFWPALNS